MAHISSMGAGSGLDLASIVTNIVTAQRQPTENLYNFKESVLQTKLSAYGTLKSELSSFQESLAGLTTVSAFQAITADSSNTDVLTIEADSTAGSGSYDVNVTTLAQANTLTSATFANRTDVVGTGTLTFKFGTTDYDAATDTYNSFTQNASQATQTVTIDSSNNTLEGIRDAINDADIGVVASVVNNGSGYQLAFVSAQTGADNSIQVSVSDSGDGNDTDTLGLSALAFNDTATNLTQAAAGVDAALTINGINITSASNTISEAIEGATLTLQSAGTSKASISQNQSSAKNSVKAFVEAYNSLMDTVDQLSSYNAETEEAAALLGDATLRSITSNMRNILVDAVSGISGKYNTLASIGIKTDSTNGKLLLDDTVLQEALDNDFDSVAKLFAVAGSPSDSLISFEGNSDETQEGSFAVNITTLATQGAYVGGAAATGAPNSIVITAGSNDTFSVKVDGVQASTVTLSAGTYTGDDLARELQSRINGDSELQDNGVTVTVSFNKNGNNEFSIVSNRYGSVSKIESVSGTATTTLGLDSADPALSADGVDVAGSIGGVAATGSGRTLTGSGDASGLQIEIRGGNTGSRGDVVFSRGIADRLNNLLSGFLDEDNIIDARVDGVQNRIDDINEQRERFAARMDALEQRLRAQFNAMDGLVAQMRSTSDFLNQQLASLGRVGGSKK